MGKLFKDPIYKIGDQVITPMGNGIVMDMQSVEFQGYYYNIHLHATQPDVTAMFTEDQISKVRPEERAISTEEYAQRDLAVSHYPGKWESAKRMCLPSDYWDRVRLAYLELGGLAVCQMHDHGNTSLWKDDLARLGVEHINDPGRYNKTPTVTPIGFYCFLEGQNTPRFVHPNFSAAHVEAERLSNKFKGSRVHVCAIYATLHIPYQPEMQRTYATGVSQPEVDMPF